MMEAHYLELAIQAAREAGRIQKARFGHSNRVELKGEINPVTEVDRLCERIISEMILGRFPDHDLFTEETPFKAKGSRWRWIIDPLDGTTNYIHRLPFFAVSIGMEVDGVMELGVAYDPVRDELFHAVRGTGAFLNGQRMTVSETRDLGQSLLCTGFPYDVRKNLDDYLCYFQQFMVKGFAIRRLGSAVLDLCYLAAGHFDGFWEFKLHPWDVAAGSLMVTEAGGQVTAITGQPFSIYSKDILASNGFIHLQMIETVQGIKGTRG